MSCIIHTFPSSFLYSLLCFCFTFSLSSSLFTLFTLSPSASLTPSCHTFSLIHTNYVYCIISFPTANSVLSSLRSSVSPSLSIFLSLFICLPSPLQKRRSGRQVKRRKYNEDLDFKVVDDDGETIAVLGTGRISALNATALAWQAEVGCCTFLPFPPPQPSLSSQGVSRCDDTSWKACDAIC